MHAKFIFIIVFAMVLQLNARRPAAIKWLAVPTETVDDVKIAC